MIFIKIIWKNSVLQHCCHTKTHPCVKYGHIITKHVRGMFISWSFVSKLIHVYRWLIFLWISLLETLSKLKFIILPINYTTHKRTPCQRISFFFSIVSLSFIFLKKQSKWPPCLFIENGRIFQNYRMLCDVTTTYVP